MPLCLCLCLCLSCLVSYLFKGQTAETGTSLCSLGFSLPPPQHMNNVEFLKKRKKERKKEKAAASKMSYLPAGSLHQLLAMERNPLTSVLVLSLSVFLGGAGSVRLLFFQPRLSSRFDAGRVFLFGGGSVSECCKWTERERERERERTPFPSPRFAPAPVVTM